MKKYHLISLVIVIVISIIVITVFLASLYFFNDDEFEKKADIKIINDCSSSIDVKIEFEMFDYNVKIDTFITRYMSYENVSIDSGETWTYIFEAPESIDSQYLAVDLASVRCGDNYTSYSHSSTWTMRRDDYYRIYEDNDGIDVDWLDKPE